MSASHHPSWRSIASGYPLPPLDEIVWGWDGITVRQVVRREPESLMTEVRWTDLAGAPVAAVSHWLPLAENPDEPPRAPNVWATRHDGLADPPQDAGFVWAFIGDDPPQRAQYRDEHWFDLNGGPLDARGLKWLRDLEFTDPARHA
jgi:hypothetical protein